jgi:hypothetical protein
LVSAMKVAIRREQQRENANDDRYSNRKPQAQVIPGWEALP